jgi:hypothetical protein
MIVLSPRLRVPLKEAATLVSEMRVTGRWGARAVGDVERRAHDELGGSHGKDSSVGEFV